MGQIYRLSCEECGYEDDLQIGAGLLSIREDILESLLVGDDLEEWKKLKAAGKVQFARWEYIPAYCPECKQLKVCSRVNITATDKGMIYLGCRCKDCETKLNALDINSDITCPVCGKSFLQKKLVRHWD